MMEMNLPDVNHNKRAKPEIDFVLTWVNGEDPNHKKKRLRFQHDAQDVHMKAVLDTRFHSCGEIYFAVASILKHANYCRKIWIVTDQQRPPLIDAFAAAGLCRADQINIIDHTEILGDVDDALPTFNSISIESALWRIPGLSEHYVYMNDDFAILKPSEPRYFFDENGYPVVRGTVKVPSLMEWKSRRRRFLRKITFRPPNPRPKFQLSQEIAAQIARRTRSFIHVDHWPHPLRVSTQANYLKANWKLFKRQVRHRFRNGAQYSAVGLANHLETKATLADPPATAYIDPTWEVDQTLFVASFFDGTCEMGCMQSIEKLEDDVRVMLLEGLVSKFGSHLPRAIADSILSPGSL